MPRRTDIEHILVIGSGPIVIGQACEFDYSGTQACRVLRAEGFRVSLINSNPATIMTDPEFADATYIEPLTAEFVEKVIEAERPDALLPTLGGQTALNLAVALHDNGVLERYGVELIGADIEAIRRGEDRQRFKDIVRSVGADVPASQVCHTLDEAIAFAATVGNRVVVRPSFTMGGLGSGLAGTADEVRTMVARGLAASPVHEVLVEESVLGWKEFELELMRDRHDNVVVVCSIENVDPMGVHTGDSITVAPAMTLTDREYQHMRDVGIAVLRAVGVDTGGCNIQFAVDPRTGRMIVIEMNPRVSRSSALASKATGFPIAKIAAKLAVGYTLDEIPNDITKKTPAAFEPAIDYIVVKVPRFAFEKFPGADPVLTTHMKSVGEAMSIGRNFTEALGKALRSMETRDAGFWTRPDPDLSDDALREAVATPTDGRIYRVEQAIRRGMAVDEVAQLSGIDAWFVDQVASLVELRAELVDAPALTPALLRKAKRHGISDRQLAALRPELAGEDGVRLLRLRAGIRPVYKAVDTCAAEFAATTPYHYSSYDEETEVAPQPHRPKVIILGSGPNRIGQGIEFDYSCVHAVMALRDAGYETVMVNCNPETVSTDYDTSDRLYFEPLTFEDVMEVVNAEQSSGRVAGVICTLGGQTPLGLAQRLKDAGVAVLGTQPEAIDLAEHRGAFGRVLREAGLPAPKHGTATSFAEAKAVADRIGYPVLVRPSYVLGGRGMEIVYDEGHLSDYISRATEITSDHPVLVDHFLDDAIEIDVDALLGATIADLRREGLLPRHGDGGDLPDDAPIAVKEAVLPFHRFRSADGAHVDSLLGPEMKSTGEVMGFDAVFGTAFAKSQAASYGSLPVKGTVFVSVANRDKRAAIFPVKRLSDLGFRIVATSGTAQVLRRNGVPVEVVGKFSDGPGNVVEKIAAGEIDLVLNTPWGNSGPRIDGYEIRTAAVAAGIPCLTTVQAAAAAVQGIEELSRGEVGVRSLQDLHAQLAGWRGAS